MKKVILLFVCFGLSGCVSTKNVALGLNRQYTGKNVDEFFVAHGVPAARHQLNSGDILYVWDSGKTSVYLPTTTTVQGTNYGNFSSYTATSSGGNAIEQQCVIQILASGDGTVKSLSVMKDTIGTWTTSMCSEVL